MNTKTIVAVTSRSFSNNPQLVKELKKRYANVVLNDSGATLSGNQLINFLSPAEKAIIGIEDLSENNLSQLPNLRVISKYGVGLNNINLDYCKSRNIKLGFVPGVNKQSVAEFALTLILLSLRKIHTNHLDISNGKWPQSKGFELNGKTISILGFGNIGQKLASFLTPFQCQINFFDERVFTATEIVEISKNNNIDPDLIKQVSFEDALQDGDIISIHLPLNEGTQNIVNKEALAHLKPSAVIVNTARGGIVNEEELLNFLKLNRDNFAAFDVFHEEPVIKNSLFELENFFGTSHRSSLTFEGINSMGMAAINGLDDNVNI